MGFQVAEARGRGPSARDAARAGLRDAIRFLGEARFAELCAPLLAPPRGAGPPGPADAHRVAAFGACVWGGLSESDGPSAAAYGACMAA